MPVEEAEGARVEEADGVEVRMEVFVLQHVHTFEGGEEDVKMIGLYSSREKAKEAFERMSARPGLRDATEGLSIDQYVLDKDYRTEGYVTVTDEE